MKQPRLLKCRSGLRGRLRATQRAQGSCSAYGLPRVCKSSVRCPVVHQQTQIPSFFRSTKLQGRVASDAAFAGLCRMSTRVNDRAWNDMCGRVSKEKLAQQRTARSDRPRSGSLQPCLQASENCSGCCRCRLSCCCTLCVSHIGARHCIHPDLRMRHIPVTVDEASLVCRQVELRASTLPLLRPPPSQWVDRQLSTASSGYLWVCTAIQFTRIILSVDATKRNWLSLQQLVSTYSLQKRAEFGLASLSFGFSLSPLQETSPCDLCRRISRPCKCPMMLAS